MNKTIRILFLISLAIAFCTSCNKVEQLIPESFERNDKPFSVEAVPVEGCDSLSLILYREKNGTITQKPLDYNSDIVYNTANTGDSVFIDGTSIGIGDSLVLIAKVKNGYTFINWVRDGVSVPDTAVVNTSSQHIYGFRVKKEDIETKTVKDNGVEKSWNIINHHYEARFGLDYALQVIPSIDEVMPAELIAEMGPYLHFGDNPPRIDSFSFDTLRLVHFIRNSDHPEIPFNPETMYFQTDGQVYINKFHFKYYGQHRGVFDSCNYLRNYGPMNWDGNPPPPQILYNLHEYANTKYPNSNDSIFIMGDGDDFTIYYQQSMKRRVVPKDNSVLYSGLANSITGGIDLVRLESVIISGTVSDQGIKKFHWGYRVEEYNKEITLPAEIKRLPAIHDMFHLEYPEPENGSNP